MKSENLAIDLYELTMAQVYFKYKPETQATFDLFIRSPKRPFYVACGIDEALSYLENFRFSKNEIEYLKSLSMFDDEFIAYLKRFRFKGTVWAVEEPEIVFAQEPIMRVTAPLIEAQLAESYLLNKINCATTLATKAARVIMAAQGKSVFDFSLRRTQGIDASCACAKYSYMVGASGTSNVLAGSLYKIPVVGTMAHSFVMTFEREIESFLYFSYQFPFKTILLVDTYAVKKGIDSAIRVAHYLKRKGIEIIGIRLDSGNLLKDGHNARLSLDKEGFIDTTLIASGDLDEYKIRDLLARKAPFDAFGVGTHLGCSSDRPYTDVIYKLVEVKNRGQNFIPTMKLSEGKTTYPGRKQIIRSFDNEGFMEKDVLALDKEKVHGKKILKKVMENGKRLCREKTLEEKRKLFFSKSMLLPSYLKELDSKKYYPVDISQGLFNLAKTLGEEIRKRTKEKVLFIDIDTQEDFLHKNGALYVPDSEQILQNAKKLTSFAHKNGILIISSQDTHKKDDLEFQEFPSHCVKGTEGHRKAKETLLPKSKIITSKKLYPVEELKKLAEKYEQLIIEKYTLCVFANPNMEPLLEAVFPDKIYLYGVVTEYCIREAVEGLIKHRFPIYIIEDAVKEISSKEKEKLFANWKERGVEFVKAQDVFTL